MNIRRKILSSSFWLLAGKGATMMSSFIVFALMARLLTPIDFGLVAFASVFIEIARRFMFGGFPEALIQRKEWDETAASTVFWLNLGSSIVLAGVLAAIGIPLASGYDSALFAGVFLALSLSLVIDALRGAQEAKLRRDFGYKVLAVRMVVASIVSGIAGVAMAFAGLGVWALVGQRLIAAMLQTIIVWCTVPWRPKFAFSRVECASLFGFGVNMMGAGLLGQLSARVPDFVVGVFLGPVALGLFRVASRAIYFLVQMTIMPIQATAFSAFSRLPDAPAVGRAYLRMTRATAFVSFPVFIGAASIAPDFVVVCFGSQWEASGPILTALALVVAPATLLYFAPPALAALGRTQLVLLSGLATFVTNAIAALVTVSFGVVAVAVGQTARAHVTAPIALHMLRKGVGLPVFGALRSIVEPGVASLLMAAVVALVRLHVLEDLSPLARLAICVILGATVYAGLLLAIFRAYVVEVMLEIIPTLPPAVRRVAETAVRLFGSNSRPTAGRPEE
jgi:O-antigen/teichoic acid export membrane protein